MKVGIVGTGFIADHHVRALRSVSDITVIGCCDIDHRRAKAFGDRWRLERWTDDLDDFLEHGHYDVIHVTVPPDRHSEVAQRALQSGCHVYLEKPMGIDSAQCGHINSLANDKGLIVGVNHNAVYHPLMQRLREDVENGVLVGLHHAAYLQSGPLGQLNKRLYSHWMFRSPRNIVFEQACHPASQIVSLLGDPLEIAAQVDGKRTLGYGQVFYDRWQALATFERGTASFHLSFGNEYFPQCRLILTGRDSEILVDLLNGLYLVQRKTIFPDYLDPLANATLYAKVISDGITNFTSYALSKLKLRTRGTTFSLGIRDSIFAFYRALKRGEPVPVSGSDGERVVRFCERWADAARLGETKPLPKPQRYDPATSCAQVLVTGANGFIGRELVKLLVNRGVRVRAVARNIGGLQELFYHPLVELVQCDIQDIAQMAEAVGGVKYVYHLAHSMGGTWKETRMANVEPSLLLAKASLEAGVKYFIFASTIATYYTGDKAGQTVDELTSIDPLPQRRSHYAHSKIVLEWELTRMRQDTGLPLVVFRPGIVVGLGGNSYHGGVGEWTRDNVCSYWGSGRNALPFVLVEDVAAALAQAMVIDGLQGHTFNLVGDVRLNAREYVECLRSFSGRRIAAFGYPIGLRFAADCLKYLIKVISGQRKEALLSYRDLKARPILANFDNSKTKRILEWMPCSEKLLSRT